MLSPVSFVGGFIDAKLVVVLSSLRHSFLLLILLLPLHSDLEVFLQVFWFILISPLSRLHRFIVVPIETVPALFSSTFPAGVLGVLSGWFLQGAVLGLTRTQRVWTPARFGLLLVRSLAVPRQVNS